MLACAIAGDEPTDVVQPPANDLLTMDGMNPALAGHLAAHGISTMEDLAECAVDDLLVIDSLDAEQAGALIMAARAPWFAEQTGEAA